MPWFSASTKPNPLLPSSRYPFCLCALQHVRLQFETEQVEDEILDEFPVTIRHKVSRALYRRVVEQCYLFKGCQPEFINQIVSGVR